MADKAISELVSAEQITATDMFVLEQNGTAKKLTGQVLLNWLTAAADGHGGIQSYALLKTEGLVKTYRFTLADQSYMDIQVTDGRGISSITKTGTSGLTDTYRISYNDGSSSTFSVTNGAKGDTGDNAYIWVKYASQEPIEGSSSFGDLPDNWIGIYWGTSETAPTDWKQYKWFKIKGEQGDTGEPAILISAEVSYQAGPSGTVAPSGTWLSTIPAVAQGQYLWTRIVQQFNTGDPITAYTVSRMGLDGLGSVVSVAGVSPNPDGNVPLAASDVGALSTLGGIMSGQINMNGQKIIGLSTPTESDEPATRGYADGLDAKKGLELIWTNAAMGSEFEATTISARPAGETSTPQDFAIVEYRLKNSGTNHYFSNLIIGKNIFTEIVYTGENGATARRTVKAAGGGSGWSFTFGQATFNGSADNSYIIPVRIYAVKGKVL